jgi:hypothetical protein
VAEWARRRWLSIFALYCCMAAIISACRMSSTGSAISGSGWEFVAETLVERLFGLQGGYAVTADTENVWSVGRDLRRMLNATSPQAGAR